jgi:hypothetical protein
VSEQVETQEQLDDDVDVGAALTTVEKFVRDARRLEMVEERVRDYEKAFRAIEKLLSDVRSNMMQKRWSAE